MTRLRSLLFVLLLTSCPIYGLASPQRPKRDTWYEWALRHVNPDNTDFGSMWEERKRAFIGQFGNPCFKFSVVAMTAFMLSFTVNCVQRVSHKRALNNAAQSIADVLRHDQYSRQVAREAIRRYNDHIEACNRMIEARQEGLSKSMSATESELQRVTQELEDTRDENRGLRNDLAKKAKISAGMTPRPAGEGEQPVQAPMESVQAQYIERINVLEKQVREE
jgi:hypothetical protein